MPKRGRVKLTTNEVRRLAPGQHADKELTGFVCRVFPNGRRLFEARYRGQDGKWRRMKCGTYPPTPPEEARRQAIAILRAVQAGEDPAAEAERIRKGASLGEVFARWREEVAVPTLKPRSLESYDTNWRKHLEPDFGSRPAYSITTEDLARHFSHLRARIPVGVNRVRQLASILFNHAERLGLRSDNPVRFIAKAREKARERLLSTDELTALGRALTAADSNPAFHPASVAITRLALLTACRKNELACLTWREVDLENALLRIEDTKTGRRVVPLSPQAVAVLAGIPREEGRPKVFLGWCDDAGRQFYANTLRLDWEAIRAAAGLDDVVFHDLRHAAGSTAAALGLAPSVIQHLLGHSDQATTQKYIHSTAEQARAVADAIGKQLDATLAGGAKIEAVGGAG